MTQTIAENANRDIYIDGAGSIPLLTKAQAVAQLCKGRIEAQRNEMIYAMNQGMPTRATAWDRFNPKQFEAAARTIFLNTPDVTAVQSFTMNMNGNTLNYSAVIQTIYGTATVSSQ